MLELSPEPRLIPARAGNTSPVSVTLSPMPAHPRSRGEHVSLIFLLILACGSSPLARGTRLHSVPCGVRHRLIPARAGNTTISRATSMPPAAHPRSRGEHIQENEPMMVISGSSPLARGTLLMYLYSTTLGRLIPARAGNTPFLCPKTVGSQAHPRSRGEHVNPRPRRVWIIGSSPLARGTLVVYGECLGARGSSPLARGTLSRYR